MEAEEEFDRIQIIDEGFAPFGADAFRYVCRAELSIAAGDLGDGLHLYRECAERMRGIELPGLANSSMEPWSLFGDALVLSAHAWYATGDDEVYGRELFSRCRSGALRVFALENDRLDLPASGLLLFALGAWVLLREAAPAQDALRLLALADRFAYNRMIPTMLWEPDRPSRRAGTTRPAG